MKSHRLRLLCICALLSPAVMASAVAATPELQYYRDAGSKAPYSPAVRIGQTVYVSGQLGVGADGKLVQGFEAQTRQAMDNVAAALKRVGLGMDDVGRCTAMITDTTQWSQFNAIYTSYFKPERLPARSAFGATGLPMGAAVEIDCIARVPAE